MVEPVPVNPGDRIDVNPERVIHDRDCLDEPLLVIECTMGDPHMDDGRQIQPTDEPANYEVSCADEQAHPGTDMKRCEIHAGQRIGEHDRVADDVVALHEDPFSDRSNA